MKMQPTAKNIFFLLLVKFRYTRLPSPKFLLLLSALSNKSVYTKSMRPSL